MYCCLHLFKVACEIDLDLALFLFDLLYVKFLSLLMHTIQDKVGIPNCSTLYISIWYSVNWIVFVITVFSLIPCSSSFLFWNFFFISSLCIFSLGVLCHLFNHFRKCIISYKSWFYQSCLFLLCAISFCLRLWNLGFQILELVLFLFDLLSAIPFCCLRLWNLPCEILVLVLFFFRSSLCDIFLFSWVVEPCLWHVFEMFVLSSVVSSKLSDVSGMCIFYSVVLSCLSDILEISVLSSVVSSKLSDVSGMCLFSSAVWFCLSDASQIHLLICFV